MCGVTEFQVTANEAVFAGAVNRQCLPLIGLPSYSQEWQRYFARYVARRLRDAGYEPGEGQVRVTVDPGSPYVQRVVAVRARVRMYAAGPDGHVPILTDRFPPASFLLGEVRPGGPTVGP